MTSIGIALSGGGVRATVFHLGVLARLAEDNLLEDVKFLSSVSGGSIAVSLIYASNENTWPNSRVYLKKCLPQIKHKLTTTNMQRSFIISSLIKPWRLLKGRAFVVAKLLEKKWGINGRVKDLDEEPRWIINATTYETGKNWRIMPRRMGDYSFGYVENPDFNISEAVASSAAFPGFIGPLVINTSKYEWFKFEGIGNKAKKIDIQCNSPIIHLWDGGLYDNLGVEALYKMGKGLREGISFLIVSDASSPLKQVSRGWIISRGNRLINIATEQARGFISRNIVNFFINHPDSGAYLQIGSRSDYIINQSKANCKEDILNGCLSGDEVLYAKEFPTVLKKLSFKEFDLLFQHGWEVANCTLGGWCPQKFSIKSVTKYF